jgi:hypothetical protein
VHNTKHSHQKITCLGPHSRTQSYMKISQLLVRCMLQSLLVLKLKLQVSPSCSLSFDFHFSACSLYRPSQSCCGRLYTHSCRCLMCTAVAQELITQLSNRFPTADLMDALGIIYPQYWLEEDANSNFEKHLKILKAHYGTNRPFSTIGIDLNPIMTLIFYLIQVTNFTCF